jgi:uncharacterized repeat protein (TIGR01451 family)
MVAHRIAAQWLVAVLFLAGIVGGPRHAVAATTFTYVKVADVTTAIPGGSGTFTSIGEPVIAGNTVFFAGSGPNGQRGIYNLVVDGVSSLAVRYDKSTAVPGSGGFFSDFSFPMASPGGIAFIGSTPAGDGIFSDLGGTLHAIATKTTPIPDGTGTFTGFGPPWVWSGVVVFRARGSGGQEGIYAHSGGGLRRVADLTTPVPGGTGHFVSFGGSSIGKAVPATHDGTIVFRGTGSGGEFGVYKEVGGVLFVVADNTTPIPGGTGTFTSFDYSIIAGDVQDGVVVFIGQGSGGQFGAYAHDGTTLAVEVDTHTPVFGTTKTLIGFGLQGFGLDAGHVAFLGDGPGLEQAVYATLGGVLRPIVVSGTVLDGRTSFAYGTYGRGISGNMVVFNVGNLVGLSTGQVADYVAIASNDPPVAVNDALSVQEDGFATVNVLANDSDPDGDILTVSAFTNGAKGTVTCTAAGACKYTATTPNYSGSDSFTYTVTDGRGGFAVGTVTVTITPVEDADIAVSMTPSQNPAGRNRPITYTIVVSNAGPESATKVTLTNSVPAGSTFVSATTTQGTLKTPAAGATGTVTATLGGLAKGANATVTLTVNVNPLAGPTLTSTASASHSGSDPVPANNSATVSVPVVSVGTFVLTPKHSHVAVDERMRLALEWTIPGPSWRDLKDLELRIRDHDGIVLWVRLTEGNPSLLALYDEKSGRFGAGAAPGSQFVLSNKTAKLYLAGTTVTADGATDPSVVLTLDVSFDHKAAGRSYVVEVKARDDLGNTQDWKRAGTLTVGRHHHEHHGKH